MSAFRLPPFYPVLDTELIVRRGMSAAEAAEAILEGGARILQFRHKGFFSSEVFEAAIRVGELCREANTLFVMNDRADIAILLAAALHLGQDDLEPEGARRIAPGATIIGLSTHNEQQLRAGDQEPVDYLALGPIFQTGSKQNPDPVVGIEGLRNLRALTRKPLVGIGGITRATAGSVFNAGADSVAIIGDLYPEPLSKAVLQKRVEEWIAVCPARS